MKWTLSFVLAGLFVFSVSKFTFSEETKTETAGKQTQDTMMAAPVTIKSEAEKPQEKMKGAFPMPLMRRDTMSKSMVATDDGGVVVMAGNKLMKFDQDLNLVKEVEIKMDMAGMEQMMMQMKEKHSMMNKPTKEGAVQAGTAQESAAKQEAPVK